MVVDAVASIVLECAAVRRVSFGVARVEARWEPCVDFGEGAVGVSIDWKLD